MAGEAPERVLTEESFLGAWQEDPALVAYIRGSLLLPPSALPYNLSQPHLEHFSQLGQSQYANDWILRNMVSNATESASEGNVLGPYKVP